MAAVSDILSLAAKLSGLRADSAESDVALAAINRAYQRACLDAELTGADATHTVTATTGSIAASAIAATAVMRVQHLRMVSSSNALSVQQVSRQEIQDNLAVDQVLSGPPTMYSVSFVGGTPTIDFYPQVTAGDQIKMSYLATPPTLTTDTTSIQYLPEMFHHDILTNAAVAMLLERDGNLEKAQPYLARALEATVRLEEYLGQLGGTSNRAYIAPGPSRIRFPDQR